ncbi:MAG: LL-diaminopimelate aminotransferase, partial [Bacteroidales bacterium]|nr:LL-diaminopimelate aminotransferase [Bacteroidales bacterium]
KSDTGNITDILGKDLLVAVGEPVYPVYVDSNIMAGRKESIVYLPCTAENRFVPELPELNSELTDNNSERSPDLIYLCYPNNPTGTTLSREELKLWVDYARRNQSLILFDAAYEAFIQHEDIPHSIYEIPGAKEVAIEFRSYSKTAGFTGLRCGYTIVPNQLIVKSPEFGSIKLNSIWNRRQSTKFNGVSYISQRAAEAVYSPEGKQQVRDNIAYYMENARILRQGLLACGLEVYGGLDAPYLWVKTPDKLPSWDFFELLLQKAALVSTPGVGFGACGEGYIRFSAFGGRESCQEALGRIRQIL